MRRALIITLIVLAILGMGVGAYFFFSAPKATITSAPGGGVSLPSAGQGAVGVGGAGAPSTSTATTPIGTPITVSSRLVQISAGPVVPGEVVLNIKPFIVHATSTASSTPDTAVQYIERGSGNIFTYSKNTGVITRINNKTIPGIQSATWLPNGSFAFVRYLSGDTFSTINTYALTATSSNGGFFLPQNLADLAVSSTSLLTLASGVNGSIASIERTNGTKPSTIFSTPLTSLRVSFVGKNQYLAFSKPSAGLSGYAFLVESNGRFSRIAGPLNGLVATASPSGKWILVSYTQNSTLLMALVNTATHEILPLPVATIADKCVWTADDSTLYCGIPLNPDASYAYPDDWYQGAVHFSDRIWKINVTGRYAQLVLDFSQADKGALDTEALAVDPANTMLVFINKNDGSLWGYSL